MSAHSDRHHARWSASATAANWTCSGRMAMVSLVPEQKESIYAAEGTAAHEISERFPIPCDEDRLEEGSIDVNRFKTSKA